MKKFLILAILVITLGGCTQKKDVNNKINDDFIPNDNVVESELKETIQKENEEETEKAEETETESEMIPQEKIESEAEEFLENVSAKNYCIDYNEWKKVNENLVFKGSVVVDESLTSLVSDNTNIKLRFDVEDKYESENNEYTWTTEVKVYVNDIEYIIKDDYSSLHKIGIFDLDENDEYKDLWVHKVYGIEEKKEVYRIEKDGLRLLANNIDETWNATGLVYNEKTKQYIYGNTIYGVSELPVIGYYIYENGEFKYIDKFLNGEEITNENGEFTENFRNAIFTGTIEGAGFWSENKDIMNILGTREFAGAKIKFVKMYKDDDTGNWKYDIEIVEEINIDWNDEKIIVEPGTIMEGLTVWGNL